MFDLFLSLFLLIILSPIFIIIAILIKLDSKGPIFYKQERVGKDGKLFNIWKFRSMIVNAENLGERYGYTKDDPRITKVGKFLRNVSLDELPQLINILMGDMSFIGPRPGLKYQVDQYSNFQKKRLLVKQGITGWAQVNGRHEITWSQRIKLDVWYVDNQSLWLDAKILLKTFKIVFNRKGVLADQKSSDFEDFGKLENYN
jgi:undecaprenyl phosphate N,N'-diacetylbacillosamine 1-phosphate transferase